MTARQPFVARACPGCNQPIAESRRSDTAFCSQDCHYTHERRERANKRQDRPCAHVNCSAVISKQDRPDARFCSAKCDSAQRWLEKKAARTDRPCRTQGCPTRIPSSAILRQKYCSEACRNAMRAQIRADRRAGLEPDQLKAKKFEERQRRQHNQYGLKNWEATFEAQGRRCACCGSAEPRSSHGWHTDHDHETGKFRGILCFYCNVGIGKLGDTLEGVQRAARYLLGASLELE